VLRSLKLGHILGISIEVDYTWFIVFALVVTGLATGYFPMALPTDPFPIILLLAVFTALALFASVLTHELAHSYVARLNGINISSITLFVFGGVARMTDEPPSAASELRIAAAGPAMSVFLAAVFGSLYVWGQVTGWAQELQTALKLLAGMNFLLAVFNLLPGFPLDGGRLLRAILWKKTGNLGQATRVASGAGQFIGYGLIVWGLLDILGGITVGGIWLIFIGWFLVQTAAASYRQMQARQMLSGIPVRHLMTTDVVAVPANITVRELVDNYFLAHGYTAYPVLDGEKLVGCVGLDRVREIAREEWATTTAADIVPPLSAEQVVSPDTDGWDAVTKMAREGQPRLLVTEGDRLVGMLSQTNVMRLIRTRLELGM
jgi:Zn-dependent protease/predicted transcriptional regulator